MRRLLRVRALGTHRPSRDNIPELTMGQNVSPAFLVSLLLAQLLCFLMFYLMLKPYSLHS